MASGQLTRDNLAVAIHSTIDLFLEDAPEMHGREFAIDPVRGEDGRILIDVEGQRYAVALEHLGDAQ